MSIRSILRDAFESSSSSSLAELLEVNGFADVAPADMGEALLHYAEVASLAEAEALAPMVISHHSRQHQLDGGSEELQLSVELPSLELATFEKLDVNDSVTEIDSRDDFDIDAEDELDGFESDDLDLDESFDDLTDANNSDASNSDAGRVRVEEQFGEGSAEVTGDDLASPFEGVENIDDGAAPVWVSSDAGDLDALSIDDVADEKFQVEEHPSDTEPDFKSEIDFE